MDTSFTAKARRSRCCEIIDLVGQLDFATAPHLQSVLDRMMVIPDHIVVDVSKLTFIDSAGLRLLLRASKLVEGRIEIRGSSLQIRRLLDVSGVADLFCIADLPGVAHQIISGRRLGDDNLLAAMPG